MSSLPKDYAYVAASGIATCVLATRMGINVYNAREKYNVPYPKMYSETENKFNCIMRVQQNTVEQHAMILFLMAMGGLEYPKTAAGMGLLWSLGRIAFAAGYSTGDPKKRRWGEFGYIGTLGLFATSIGFVLKKLDIL